MRLKISLLLVGLIAMITHANALSISDQLTSWSSASAIDRMALASRFEKSFYSLNETFTADYFLKCIDDISRYDGAKAAKVEDAMQECVASQERLKRGIADDDE